MAEGNANDVNEKPVTSQETTETKVETPPEQKVDAGTTKEEAPEKTEVTTERQPSGAEKRIKQLIAERNKERELRLAAEEKLSNGERKGADKPESVDGLPPKPVASNYSDYDEYISDLGAWKKEVKDIQKQREDVQKKQRDTMQSIETSFQTRIEADAEKNPDITTLRDKVGMKISPAVGLAIKQSEISPDLIRYLDANPSEMERLSKLDLVAAAREIGKIEVKLTSKGSTTTKKKTDAPEPIKKSEPGSGPSVTTEKKSDDEIPITDYMKEFRKRSRK